MKKYILLIQFALLVMFSSVFASDLVLKNTLSPASFTKKTPSQVFTVRQWDDTSNQFAGITIFSNPNSMKIADFLELAQSRTKDESRIFEWDTKESDGTVTTRQIRIRGDQVFLSVFARGEELSLVCSLKDLSSVVREKEAYKSEYFQSLLLFHNQLFNQYQPQTESKGKDLLWEALKTTLGRRIATFFVMSAMSTGFLSNAYGMVANADKLNNEIKIEQAQAETSTSVRSNTYQFTDYDADGDGVTDSIPQEKGKIKYLEEMNADQLFKHISELKVDHAEKAIEVHYDDFRMDPNFKALTPFHQNLVSRFLEVHKAEGINKSRLSSSVLDYQQNGYHITDLALKAADADSYDLSFSGAKEIAVDTVSMNSLSDENEALFKSIVAENPYVDQNDLLEQLLKLEAKGNQFRTDTITGKGYSLTFGTESHIKTERNLLKISNQEKMEVEFQALYKPNYANPDQSVLKDIIEKGALQGKQSLTLTLHGGADPNSAALEYQNMEEYIQKNIQGVINGTLDASKLEAFSKNLMKKNYSNVDFNSSQMKNILKNTLVNMILGSEETMAALAAKGVTAEDVKALDLKDIGTDIDGKTLDITGNAALTSVRIAVLDASFKALGLQNYKVLNNFLADGIEDIHSIISANQNSVSIIEKILAFDGKAKSIDDLSNDRILDILKDPSMKSQKNALFSQMRNSGISVAFDQTGLQTVALKTLLPESFEQTINKPNADADVYIDGSNSMSPTDVSIFLNYLDDLGVKSIEKGSFHIFGEKIKAMDFESDKKAMTKKIVNSIRNDKLGDEENHYQLVKKEIGKYLSGKEKDPKTIFIATDEAIQGFSYKSLIEIKKVIDSANIPLDLKFLIISSNTADVSKNYVKSLDLNTMVDLSLQMAFARGTRAYSVQLNPVMKSIKDLETKQSTQGLSEAEAKQLKLSREQFMKISNLRIKAMYRLYNQYKKSGDKISFSDVQLNASFKGFEDENTGKMNYNLFHEQYKQVFGLFQKAA